MRRSPIIVLIGLLAAVGASAGDEFPARAGEAVAANELIVRIRTGAAIGPLIAGYVTGSQISPLGREQLFRISVPGGLPPGVSTRLAANPLVDYVEPNRVRFAVSAPPNDPNYASSWWFPTVQALQAWSLLPGKYITSGAGRIKVAVLDTGADCTHPDFINTGGSSTDSALGGQLMFSASQALVATTTPSPTCPWQDDHGHGTHVTGIVAAATSNGIGVSGLAYPVQVIEFKVLDSSGNGFDSTIANAIMAAADAGAQVVSLSLGGAGYSQTLQTAVNYAWQRNTLVVAAAGNSASSSLFFPAGANHAVGVSATDISNNLASFSNFGNSVQLAAPGVGILSTAPTYPVSTGWNNYVSLSGTSMATPFVSALAGLVAMSTPNATAQAILQRMEQSANSITVGGGWNQSFGFGIINASSAIAGTLRTAVDGAMTGQVVNAAINPITGAQVTVNGQNITTDSTGLYRFPTLPAGTYTVTVSASGFPTQSLSATVAPGADTSFTVMMGVTYGRFQGVVTDQGSGIPGAIVQAISNGLITSVAVADPAGNYTLWTPAGTYDVRASAIGRNTASISALSVLAGGTTSANIVLPRMGTIGGSVRDGSSNPVANAQVLITGGTFSAAATTDGGGNYALIAVPNGTQYSAVASATGFLPSTQNGISVSSGTTTTVNFSMASSTVATPTFNPPAGTYSSPQPVSISTATAGASIRYTTDGSTPTSSVGTLYISPVSVNSSLTLKAIAYKSGMTDSLVGSAAYVINSGGGPSWYNPSWTSRKAITIDHTKVSGPSNLTNFPMLFSVTDANLKSTGNGGSVGKADGADILFTAGDGVSMLDHAIELYNPASGQVSAWVRIPSLSASVDTVIYVYFGNPAAADQQNRTGVWDSNFKGVWHMTDSGSPLTDTTANGNSASTRAGNPAYGAAGEVGNAVNFNAGAELVTNSAVDLSASSAATLEAWVNGNLINDSQEILNFGTLGISPTSLGIAVHSSGYTNWGPALVVGLGTGGLNQRYATAPSSNAWHHIVATYDTAQPAASEMKLYVDGVSQTLTSYAGNNNDNAGTLGSAVMYFSGYFFNWSQWTGKLDEVRISNLARPTGWITTEFSNQSAPGTFFTEGSLETSGTPVVAAPTFNPPAGTYSSPQPVSISTTTAGASIRYTTDGSTPSSSVGTVYVSPVSVNSSLTLKAIAYKSGMTDSTVASAAYTIGGGGPSWYNPSWTNRKAVTIDHTRVSGGASLINFPVLFSATDANLKSVGNGGKVGKIDGTDILFTASDGVSKLDHAVELYSAASGQVSAWVRIPSLSSTVDTVIYIYFGNPAASDQQNKTSVWDSNFKGVWHMSDTGSPLTDTTTNGNSASTRAGNPAYSAAGEVGNAVSFSAGAELVTNSAVDLSASSAATVEAWVNGDLINDSQEILNFGTFGFSPAALQIAVRSSGYTNWGPALVVGLGTGGLNQQYAAAPSSNAWHHIVATYDTAQPAATEMKLYVDGVAQTLTTYAGNNNDNSGTLGSASLYFSGYFFNWYQWTGKLDEVRISNLARPAGWIATEYSNQAAPGAFYSLGPLQ